MSFAGLVPRELMFEGHVTFERIFQKIVKLRKICRSQGAVTHQFFLVNLLCSGLSNRSVEAAISCFTNFRKEDMAL